MMPRARKVVSGEGNDEVKTRMMFARGGEENYLAQRRRGAEEGVMTENEITGDVLDASIKLHRQFGAGLLESVYES